MVRKPNLALQQVIRRISEGQHMGAFKHVHVSDCVTVKNMHTYGPVPRQYQAYQQYKELHFSDYYISVYQVDNCILIRDSVGLVRNILSKSEGSEKSVLYEKFGTSHNFFTYPLQSMDLKSYKSVKFEWLFTCCICKFSHS